MFLGNWFSTIFCIFIYSFPDIHLFLINCNLFRFRNRLWTFLTHFYSFTSGFCAFVLVYQTFVLVSTRLPFTSCFYSFTNRFYSFLLIYQSFLLVYLSFQISVLMHEPCPTSNVNKHIIEKSQSSLSISSSRKIRKLQKYQIDLDKQVVPLANLQIYILICFASKCEKNKWI